MNNRYQKLLSLLQNKNLDAILIMQPENRRYFSGFTGSSGYVVISKEKNHFITDFRYVEQSKKQCEGFELSITGTDKNWMALLNGFGYRRIGIEDGFMDVATYSKLKKEIPAIELIALGNELTRIRAIKEEEEIADIRMAAHIADEAFTHILGYVKPQMSEMDVQMEMEFFMRKKGASGLSFDMIVASGIRSALPHGVASSKIIESGDLLTLDFGCIYKGYCSDMTRTIVIGKANSRQKEIYQTVLDAQQKVYDFIKPGASCQKLDEVARQHIIQQGYGQYFGHGLGHGVGLEIHELPNVNPQSMAILAENMVITNEPGIYIPNFGGVRIEDLIVVRKDGYEILSESPKELIEI